MAGKRVTSSGSATSKSELRVLLVGETGCGKSVAGNALLGADLFTAGAEAKAHPKDKCFRGESEKIKGWDKVVVVDTPGKFFYISDKDEKTKKGEITKVAGMLAPGPHVIILVLTKANKDNAVRRNEEKIMQFYESMFGENIRNHFVFLFSGIDNDADTKATLPKGSYLNERLKDTIKGKHKNYLAFNVAAASKAQNSEKLLRVINNVVEGNNWNYHTAKVFKDVQVKNEGREQEIKKDQDVRYRQDTEKLKKWHTQKIQDLERKYATLLKDMETDHKKKTHPENLKTQVRDEYQNETGIWDTVADVSSYLWQTFSPYVKKYFKK
ncbi:GTPase IMAP family member 4-like [Mizuhopecten yessoensis]|uniref:GTPase IMAP family member 4 n=1 Tax=Mizuhopecten yessoensis TaxID=6573 RepID=A0A210QNX7_MIZYE|nr:GTPase IMAP family member 4-like [Mizuhopecten yessoensis]OWF50443.1 GTPase IMAP family member 4 [Mizuhopecten yessoensis]